MARNKGIAKSKGNRRPTVPPVQQHRDRKKNPLRKPKHPFREFVSRTEVDGDWQDF